MINIKKERRHRKAVELICKKLEITNEELDAFIEDKQEAVNPVPVIPTAGKVIEEIQLCTTIESLEKFKDDERKTVVKAYNKKLKELE